MANKLLSLHMHLKELGHPRYLKPKVTLHLECNVNTNQFDGEVCVHSIHTVVVIKYSCNVIVS